MFDLSNKNIYVGNQAIDRIYLGDKVLPQVYIAQDSDFVTFSNGAITYRGESLEVDITDYVNRKGLTTLEYMFAGTSYNATPVTKIVLGPSNVTSTLFMFWQSPISTLDLSNFDTSNVTSMSGMFREASIESLDLSSFDTSNVTNMATMFREASIESLDLSNFDTSNVTSMSAMFRESSIELLDLSSFDTSNVTSTANMFWSSTARTGYARTQTDADLFNSTNTPSQLTFVVHPDLV